jgi:hypothetical protein
MGFAIIKEGKEQALLTAACQNIKKIAEKKIPLFRQSDLPNE